MRMEEIAEGRPSDGAFGIVAEQRGPGH